MVSYKYIMIPEYRPLYAMQKCFGPTHGPLVTPTLTPVHVIRELLMQTGKEKLTILEVVKDATTGKMLKPAVELNLDNYNLHYADILRATIKVDEKYRDEEARVVEITTENEVVKPEIVQEPVIEVIDTTEVVEEAPVATESVVEPVIEVIPPAPVAEEAAPVVNPYAGMTKAERKAARRAERAAAAQVTYKEEI